MVNIEVGEGTNKEKDLKTVLKRGNVREHSGCHN